MDQRILELMRRVSYQSQPTMFPILTFIMVRTMLKYGINPSGVNALGGYGVLLCAFGKMSDGQEMAKVSELMSGKAGYDLVKSRALFTNEGCITHWVKPLQNSKHAQQTSRRLPVWNGDW